MAPPSSGVVSLRQGRYGLNLPTQGIVSPAPPLHVSDSRKYSKWMELDLHQVFFASLFHDPWLELSINEETITTEKIWRKQILKIKNVITYACTLLVSSCCPVIVTYNPLSFQSTEVFCAASLFLVQAVKVYKRCIIQKCSPGQVSSGWEETMS